MTLEERVAAIEAAHNALAAQHKELVELLAKTMPELEERIEAAALDAASGASRAADETARRSAQDEVRQSMAQLVSTVSGLVRKGVGEINSEVEQLKHQVSNIYSRYNILITDMKADGTSTYTLGFKDGSRKVFTRTVRTIEGQSRAD